MIASDWRSDWKRCICMADSAAATLSWYTLGTSTSGGPVETVTVTVEPYGALAPGAGEVEITSPLATVVEVAVAWVAARPTALRAAWACA